MAKKTYRGVTRSRPLTKSEAAKYRKIRKQIAEEIPPVEPPPEKVAVAKLRAMREAKGVSLSELAARTGMTRGNLARLESQKNATLRSLRRYANGLDCELEINFVSVEVTKKWATWGCGIAEVAAVRHGTLRRSDPFLTFRRSPRYLPDLVLKSATRFPFVRNVTAPPLPPASRR